MSTRSKGFAFLATTGGLLLVATTIAGAATSGVAVVETLQPGATAPPAEVAAPPDSSLSVGSIGPNGLSIYPASPANLLGGPSQNSHSQGSQLCKIYTSLADFTTDHGSFSRLNCALDACLEDFQCTPQAAAALLACTSGQDMDCTGANTICTPNPSTVVGCSGSTIVKGVAIREQNPRPQVVAGQVGLLQFGPAWFSNPTKFVGNNFFSDSLLIKFSGLAAACSSGNPLPKVVGFNPVNYQNHSTALNYVTVNITGGKKFVYTTLADNSQRYFTGVCCTDGIESIELAHNGAFGEGIDNLAFGKGGTCTTPKVEVTPNQLSDALEALETKLDKLKCDVDLTSLEKKLDVLEIKLDPPASGKK